MVLVVPEDVEDSEDANPRGVEAGVEQPAVPSVTQVNKEGEGADRVDERFPSDGPSQPCSPRREATRAHARQLRRAVQAEQIVDQEDGGERGVRDEEQVLVLLLELIVARRHQLGNAQEGRDEEEPCVCRRRALVVCLRGLWVQDREQMLVTLGSLTRHQWRRRRRRRSRLLPSRRLVLAGQQLRLCPRAAHRRSMPFARLRDEKRGRRRAARHGS